MVCFYLKIHKQMQQAILYNPNLEFSACIDKLQDNVTVLLVKGVTEI